MISMDTLKKEPQRRLYKWVSDCCDDCGLPRTIVTTSESVDDVATTAPKQPLLVCQRCKCYAYHDAECQRNHWKKGHKQYCKILCDALQPLVRLSESAVENRHQEDFWWNRITHQEQNDIHRIWTANVRRWNCQKDYIQAMNGFQQALVPATKAWLHYSQPTTNVDFIDPSSSIEFAIRLAPRLLFCAYCEADCSQIESARTRLVQCLSILLHLRRAVTTAQGSKLGSLLQQEAEQLDAMQRSMNDAWMELMLSYDEIPHLRRMSRHVVHLAITLCEEDPSWCCGWVDPLQRPGYMITNIDTDNNSPFLNIPFLSRSDHPGWCKVIEDNWEKILKELLSLNPSGKGKHSGSDSTWTVVGSGERGSGGDDHRVVSAGGKWTEYVLFGTGSQISDSDVPFTKKLLRECASDAVSLAESGGGEVIFSRLAPKTHIEAHCGPTNLRLTCHLGLVVPKSIVGGDHLDDNDENDDDGRCGIRSGKCQIRVGTSWYTWKTGKVIVFDDSWEHEVLNDTDEERIVLLLRFWHPSLKCGNERDHHLRAARQGKESAVIKRYHPPD